MNQNETPYFQDLPIHVAAWKGDIEIILSCSADALNQTDARGLTPLHVAILSKQTECALQLIKKGVDVNKASDTLLSSDDKQDRDRVKSMFYSITVEEWKLEVPFDVKATALHIASATGQMEVVAALIQHKAKVNAKTKGGLLPLHYAALNGHAAIIRLLLENKSKWDAKTSSQTVPGWFDAEMTALHAAAQSGDVESINCLLEAGCSALDYTKGGCGSILFAVRSENSNALKLLLEQGASIETEQPRYFNDPMNECILRSDRESAALLIPKLKNINGIDALENGRKVLLWQPPIRIAIRYQQQDIIQQLLQAGAQLPVYNNIEDALFFGDLQAVKKYYQQGNTLTGKNVFDESPLFFAVDYGYVALTQFLLENGFQQEIDHQQPSRNNNTALHAAALSITSSTHPLELVWYKKHCIQIAGLLLENGANPNSENVFGQTPLDIAFKENNQEIISLLQASGGKANKFNQK